MTQKKKLLKKAGRILLAAAMIFGVSGCQKSSESAKTAAGPKTDVTIVIPDDTTNRARALLLLKSKGYIELSEEAGSEPSVEDVTSPDNIHFVEAAAEKIPEQLDQVDFGVINANYALNAGLDPAHDTLLKEDNSSRYANVVAVAGKNKTTLKTKVLAAALESREVADYISKTYHGAVVSTVSEPGNGYDGSVNYDNLAGQTIVVAATAKPHAEILEVAAEILKEKEITLDIIVCDNYEESNGMVESGEADADYFQHEPFLEAYNEASGTSLAAAASIHSEPMGLYPGTRDSLEGVR